MDSSAEIRVGCESDWLWPSILRPSLSKPEAICQRSTTCSHHTAERTGDRDQCYCLLINPVPLDQGLLDANDLLTPFRPDRLVEEGLREFYGRNAGSPLPRELLRDHLAEALAPNALRQNLDLRGNRLCIARLAEGPVLLAHCCGAISHLPALSVLDPSGAFTDMQCTGGCLGMGIGHPIRQIAFSHPRPPSSQHGLAALPRLVCRSDHWLEVFEITALQIVPAVDERGPDAGLHGVDEGPDSFQWRLKSRSSLQTTARLADVSWNPVLTAELAYTCEDGSVGLVDTSCGSQGAKNDLEASVVRPPGGGDGIGAARCQWGNHPRILYVTQGHKLLKFDLRASVSSPAVTVLHSQPEGLPLVALAVLPHPSPFVATATARHVLLLDSRRPRSALLKWDHSMHEGPPQSLSCVMQAADEQDRGASSEGNKDKDRDISKPVSRGSADAVFFSSPEATKMPVKRKPPPPVPTALGCIMAANFDSGRVMAFRFSHAESTVRMVAHPPKPSVPSASQLESEMGRISVHPTPRSLEQDAGESGWGGRVVWTPHFAGDGRSLELPQRVVTSLKERRDMEERSMLRQPFDAASCALLEQGADTRGVAMQGGLWPADGDALLARLDFLGNLYLDACVLHQEGPPPTTLARRVMLQHPAYCRPEAAQPSTGVAGNKGQGGREGDASAGPKGRRRGGNRSMPRTPKGELTLMPKIISASMEAWRDRHAAGSLPGGGVSTDFSFPGGLGDHGYDSGGETLLPSLLAEVKEPETYAELRRRMSFTEPPVAEVKGRQSLSSGEVPDVLSATGTFVNAKSQFCLDPAARHIARLLQEEEPAATNVASVAKGVECLANELAGISLARLSEDAQEDLPGGPGPNTASQGAPTSVHAVHGSTGGRRSHRSSGAGSAGRWRPSPQKAPPWQILDSLPAQNPGGHGGHQVVFKSQPDTFVDGEALPGGEPVPALFMRDPSDKVPGETLQMLRSLEQEWVNGTSSHPSDSQPPLVGGGSQVSQMSNTGVPSETQAGLPAEAPWPAVASPSRTPSQKRMRQIAEGFS